MRPPICEIFEDIPKDARSSGPISNWSRTFDFTPSIILKPYAIFQVQQIVERCSRYGLRISVIGSGHSPSHLVKQKDVLVSIDRLDKVLEVDENDVATIEGGITLNQLNISLQKRGYALPVLGSISEQTISGAIATATHGTGINFGTLSSYVTGVEAILADGKLHTIQDGDRHFNAFRSNLGMLGIVVRVSMKVEKSFKLKATQKLDKFDNVLDHLDELLYKGEHTRFWWAPHTDDVVTWTASRTNEPLQNTSPQPPNAMSKSTYENLLYGTTFVPSLVPIVNRMWLRRMIHEYTTVDHSFNVFNFDCLFHQDVSEWAIPKEKCADAMRALRHMITSKGYKVHASVEVRFTKRDNVWMSPCFERDVCYIGVIMFRPHDRAMPSQVRYFRDFCHLMLTRFDGRPHLAKPHHTSSGGLHRAFPMLNEFLKVKKQVDPTDMFGNVRGIFRLEKKWLKAKL